MRTFDIFCQVFILILSFVFKVKNYKTVIICKMNLFLLPLLNLLQKDKWFYLILHSLTYLQIAQLKHFSVIFYHFLFIDLYIGSFPSMKYSYFHA